MLVEVESAADGWNFGRENESVRNVEWTAREPCQLWGGGAQIRIAAGATYHEARNLTLDISKTHVRLNWHRWTVAKALAHVVRWHKGFLAGEDTGTLCARDMMEYDSNRQSSIAMDFPGMNEQSLDSPLS